MLQNTPELLSLDVGRVVDLQVPTLGNNLLSRKGTLGVPPSRVFQPGLDGLDVVPVFLVFVFKETNCDRYEEGSRSGRWKKFTTERLIDSSNINSS